MEPSAPRKECRCMSPKSPWGEPCLIPFLMIVGSWWCPKTAKICRSLPALPLLPRTFLTGRVPFLESLQGSPGHEWSHPSWWRLIWSAQTGTSTLWRHYMLTWISGKTHPRRGSVSWSCVPCDLTSCWWYMVVGSPNWVCVPCDLTSCWWYMVVGSTNWVCVQDTSRNEIFRIQDLMYNDVQSLECTFMIIYVHLLWTSHIQLCPCWIQVIYGCVWKCWLNPFLPNG